MARGFARFAYDRQRKSSGRAKKRRTSSPLTIRPTQAAPRSWPRIKPMTLRMSAVGDAVSAMSPPRARMGVPHPGRSRNMTRTVPNETKARDLPTRLTLTGLTPGSPSGSGRLKGTS